MVGSLRVGAKAGPVGPNEQFELCIGALRAAQMVAGVDEKGAGPAEQIETIAAELDAMHRADPHMRRLLGHIAAAIRQALIR